MDLWIRTQSKRSLIKVKDIITIERKTENVIFITSNEWRLGTYKSYERALQILDDINNKIKNQFIVKVNTLLKPNDEKKIKDELEMNYNGDFIMENPMLDIKPINQNIIYYEMPEE